MRCLALLLLVAIAAVAQPVYRTMILVTPGSDEVVGAALVAALTTGSGTKLDACWTRALDRKVKVEVTTSRVTKVEPVGAFEESEQGCLVRELQRQEVAEAKGLVVVTLDLKSRSRPDLLANLQGGLKPGKGGGAFVLDGEVVPTALVKEVKEVKEVKVSFGEPSIEGTLSADQINRVVKARAGLFRNCYTTELEREPGLEGTLAMSLSIGRDGAVVSARRSSSSTLTSIAVEACVSSLLMRLKFPATSKGANVGVPFSFMLHR